MNEYQYQISRKGNHRRWLEAFLVTGVVAGLCVWGWSVAGAALDSDRTRMNGGTPGFKGYVTQTRENLTKRVRRLMNGTEAAPPEAGSAALLVRAETSGMPVQTLAEQAVVGRLSVPRLGLHATIREGTAAQTLSAAVGHITGTALPGQNGNVGVAAYQNGAFRDLRNLSQTDEIRLETSDAVFIYRMESSTLARPGEVIVVKPDMYPELTLVSCDACGNSAGGAERVVVKARQVAQIPLVDVSTSTPPPEIAPELTRQNEHTLYPVPETSQNPRHQPNPCVASPSKWRATAAANWPPESPLA